jgi:HTH-type transcriptional regulator/antitoxin HigA
MTRANKRTGLFRRYGKQEARYLELIHQFPLRPIKNESDLDAATKVIDSIIDRDRFSRAETDYLDVISDQVEAYEDIAYPIRLLPHSVPLRFLMEKNRLSQAAVAKATGIAVSTISEVLSGKRKLNRRQIGKLAKYFHVGPGVFQFDGK